jgi:phage terminase small subunit
MTNLLKGIPKAIKKRVNRRKNKILEQYPAIKDDEPLLAILEKAAGSEAIILYCEMVLQEEGFYFRDRFGGLKPHPLTNVLRDARSAFLQSMKALHLDPGVESDEPDFSKFNQKHFKGG